MSTLTLIPAAVKPSRPTCLACGAADFHLIDCPVGPDRHTARVLPLDCRPETVEIEPADDAPADAPEPFTPTSEDAEWWAAVCDHSDWARENELSPSEQDAELDHLDRYNAALEAMYEESHEADMIATGIPCW